jgi:hypothetical protein
MDDRTVKHSAKGLRTDTQRMMTDIHVGGVEKLFFLMYYFFFITEESQDPTTIKRRSQILDWTRISLSKKVF